MKDNELIQDVEFEEIYTDTTSEETDPPHNVFERLELQSQYFGCCAAYFNNFGVMSNSVWWGYRLGYYLIIFPTLMLTMFALDLAIILTARILLYVLKKFFDLIMGGLQPFAKIIMGAIAIIIVTLFLSNQGWDGLNSLYKSLCEWLSGCFE